MSPELDKALCEKYPLIFADRNGAMSTTAMCWGFDVEDGWYSLIDVLCEEVQRETDHQGAPQVVATQVKEKYGGLRFYVAWASDRQMAMIDLAEALSYRVCEVCGSPGSLNEENGPWMTTRCRNHTANKP